MKWDADSDWDSEESKSNKSGSTLLIPISKTENQGVIIRSHGYAERIKASSEYELLSNETFPRHLFA